jgi:predicted O-linked N-acetylglucosamine transferase (SPINDLY family)
LKKFDYFNKQDHINLYRKIDLSLDTFPYNGVTTTFESLWMNVPVLVMKGFNFNSRCGESIMKNINLENFISENREQYVSKALMFSKDREILKKTREKIFKDLKSSPLFNTKDFAKDFNDVLLKIYNS